MKACESQYCYLMSVAGWPFLWESRGKTQLGNGLGVRSWERGGQGGRWDAGLHLGSSQTHVKHENNQMHQ